MEFKMKLILNGLEIQATFTPAIKGKQDGLGRLMEPDLPADIEINDVKIQSEEGLKEHLYENYFHEMIFQAMGVVDNWKQESEYENKT